MQSSAESIPPALDGKSRGGQMTLDFAQELKARPQWVLWRQEVRYGKPTKVPYQPRYPKRKASITNPDTWGTFEQALSVASTSGFSGIGYVFSPQDNYAGVDLDKCRNPKTGEIKPWAKAIIDRLQSYTEISPSDCGVHILIKGTVPSGGNKREKVEMYSQGRYFTMTGHHLEGTPTAIKPRQSELEALHQKIFGKPQARAKDSGPSAALQSDRELIEKAHNGRNGDKFSRLWRGDTTGYKSPSEATAALCLIMAYWTGKDPGRMDRLFRESGLMRPKWDRPQSKGTWGALEIGKAIDLTHEVYTPPEAQDRPQGEARQDTGEDKTSEDPKFKNNPFPEVISAADLENMDFPEIEYLIKDIMPSGFGLISARPKKGKSFLALNISVAKATGGCALGNRDLRLELGTVLYIAYEDKNRRVKNRLTAIMQGEPFPQKLYLAEIWPRLPDGGLDRIDKWLTLKPNTKFVVIDTLGRFKPRKLPRQDDYEADLATGAALADLAHKHNVCILGVYHNRKAESDDPLDDVHGSTGMTAAADFVMVLRRGRGQADAELFVTGRDIEEKTLALRFHKAEGLWELLGAAEDVVKSQSRQKICLILKEHGPMTTKELSKIINKKENSIKKLLYRMKGDNEVRFDDGIWKLI
jgi:putative DNA primase/helicase